MEPSAGPALDATGQVIAFSSRHPIDAADRGDDFDLFVRALTPSPDHHAQSAAEIVASAARFLPPPGHTGGRQPRTAAATRPGSGAKSLRPLGISNRERTAVAVHARAGDYTSDGRPTSLGGGRHGCARTRPAARARWRGLPTRRRSTSSCCSSPARSSSSTPIRRPARSARRPSRPASGRSWRSKAASSWCSASCRARSSSTRSASAAGTIVEQELARRLHAASIAQVTIERSASGPRARQVLLRPHPVRHPARAAPQPDRSARGARRQPHRPARGLPAAGHRNQRAVGTRRGPHRAAARPPRRALRLGRPDRSSLSSGQGLGPRRSDRSLRAGLARRPRAPRAGSRDPRRHAAAADRRRRLGRRGEGDEALSRKFSDVATLFAALDPRVSRVMFGKLARAVLDLQPETATEPAAQDHPPGPSRREDRRRGAQGLPRRRSGGIAVPAARSRNRRAGSGHDRARASRASRRATGGTDAARAIRAWTRARGTTPQDAGLDAHAKKLTRIDREKARSFAEFSAFDLALDPLDRRDARRHPRHDWRERRPHRPARVPAPAGPARTQSGAGAAVRRSVHAPRSRRSRASSAGRRWRTGCRGCAALSAACLESRPDVAEVIAANLAALLHGLSRRTPGRTRRPQPRRTRGRGRDPRSHRAGRRAGAPRRRALAGHRDQGQPRRGPAALRSRGARRAVARRGARRFRQPPRSCSGRSRGSSASPATATKCRSGSCSTAATSRRCARRCAASPEDRHAARRGARRRAGASTTATGSASAAEETLWHFPKTESDRQIRDLLGRREFVAASAAGRGPAARARGAERRGQPRADSADARAPALPLLESCARPRGATGEDDADANDEQMTSRPTGPPRVSRPETGRPEPADAHRVDPVALLKGLVSLRRLTGLYPAGHPAIEQKLAELDDSVQRHIRTATALRMDVIHGSGAPRRRPLPPGQRDAGPDPARADGPRHRQHPHRAGRDAAGTARALRVPLAAQGGADRRAARRPARGARTFSTSASAGSCRSTRAGRPCSGPTRRAARWIRRTSCRWRSPSGRSTT